ncbi:E3 ubiquitin-protein ligase RNF187 [Odocoileus virginianus]|uniref:E3 ubiquitin-protein ligase RNF187 n=1 Tax=Odocoileus virginianus TaxID=9874 RepID=A0A6J0XKI3_ODOVR
MGPFGEIAEAAAPLGSCPGCTGGQTRQGKFPHPAPASTPPAPVRSPRRLPPACVLALRHSCAMELHSAAPLQSFVRGPVYPASLHCCRLRARLPFCALLSVSREPLRAGSQRQASLERLCRAPTFTSRRLRAEPSRDGEAGHATAVLSTPALEEELGGGERSEMMGWAWKSSVTGLDRAKSSPQGDSFEGPAAAALALPAGPGEAACALCQSAPRDPVRADCGHRFCRACVVRFWAEEDGPFPCPECADDCWQRAVEPGRPPLSRRLLALEEAAAAPTRDGPASEAALQLLCRADGGPLCAACRMAAGPEPPEWEPRWRKALRGKENKGSVEIMKKDLNDARDLHGQAESAAAVWKGHVMDRRKKALTDYRKLRAFFAEEEGRFLQEAEKEEGSLEDEDEDPAERFRSLLQAVSELERRHRNLGLSMLLQ